MTYFWGRVVISIFSKMGHPNGDRPCQWVIQTCLVPRMSSGHMMRVVVRIAMK